MKKYTEMTRGEILAVVNRGGDKKEKLNQMVSDHLHSLDLSEEAQSIITQTGIGELAECFGGLFTAEEVEDCISECY